jgi:small subunit ribosomal protein S17
MSSIKNIGIPGVKAFPTKQCEDRNCPFHGNIRLRGRSLIGKVVSTKMHGTIVFQRDYNFYVKKYQRYERRRSKLSAHVPDCMDIDVGDIVKVVESRKISKTVNFIVIEKLTEEEK